MKSGGIAQSEHAGSYSAHWRDGSTECGVSASAYGVNFWWSTGPGPDDGWGESYTWERWYAEGKARGGGPGDMLARIEAVGRFLGHAPKPEPRARRAELDIAAANSDASNRAYLRDLKRQAAHSTPETLRVSRRQFERLRKQVLDRARVLWELLYPGTKVRSNPPFELAEGTRSKRITAFHPPNSALGYSLVEVEDRVAVSTGVSTWYALRVQCTISAQRQFGIWFVDGECQWELVVADEAAVDRLGAELARTHPDWFDEQKVCGAIHAFVDYPGGNRAMFNRCVGRTGPTRLAEQQGGQLWPNALPQPSPPLPVRQDWPVFRNWPTEVTQILGFAFAADIELRRHAIESGLHWIEPIGAADNGCWLGLRRLPQLPPECWPVLICHGPNAATVATELRDSLAILVWWLGPRDDAGRTEILRRQWPGIEDQVDTCAHNIGGSAAIDRLRRWLETERDPDLEQPGSPQHLAAVARTLSLLDPGQSSFRRQIVALAQSPDQSLQLDDIPLAWRGSLAATGYSARVSDPDRAWLAANALPSLDFAGRFGIDHCPNVKSEASLPALAARVALRQARAGSLARALQELTDAQTAGSAYDGIAHIEAAASASIAGDHETAWQLLAAAGFWSARANGAADPVIFEAARAVARDAGYGELLLG